MVLRHWLMKPRGLGIDSTSMKHMFSIHGFHRKSRGFSLVEVVVAVGVFALAIVAVIGLLAPLGNSVTEVRDGDDASRVATTIQAGLQDEVSRLKQSSPSSYWADFAGYLNGGTLLYASRDGSIVGKEDSTVTISGTSYNIWDTDRNGSVSADESMQKFFEVTLTRNTSLSPAGADNDAAAGFLAFNITLKWPGYVRFGDGEARRVYSHASLATARAQQSIMILPAAVVR